VAAKVVMGGGRPQWCVHPKCLGFETQGVYATVADRQTLMTPPPSNPRYFAKAHKKGRVLVTATLP